MTASRPDPKPPRPPRQSGKSMKGFRPPPCFLNADWRSGDADSKPSWLGVSSASKYHGRELCEIDPPLRGERNSFGLQLSPLPVSLIRLGCDITVIANHPVGPLLMTISCNFIEHRYDGRATIPVAVSPPGAVAVGCDLTDAHMLLKPACRSCCQSIRLASRRLKHKLSGPARRECHLGSKPSNGKWARWS